MVVVYTVLLALPIGLLVRTRGAAVLTYLVLGSWVFSFQTATVVLSWLGHSGQSAFGPFPESLPAAADMTEVFGYAAVNAAAAAIGVGLALLGHRLRAQQAARRDVVAVP